MKYFTHQPIPSPYRARTEPYRKPQHKTMTSPAISNPDFVGRRPLRVFINELHVPRESHTSLELLHQSVV
jgi:hypothetical protein